VSFSTRCSSKDCFQVRGAKPCAALIALRLSTGASSLPRKTKGGALLFRRH
jgi:hypothetical protein